ncbi:MAG: twin-arginine translocase TatA/TatE family subunit [Candidatus Korarchaeum sp.]|nr:twin-arginine translocase TatA/TatE family subunit [Candidatus Korarchaeum sp.]MDW8035849.1 twin-arginine translocase TatA/TatE family subunit [Candidatus Korarchaeum sp.]
MITQTLRLMQFGTIGLPEILIIILIALILFGPKKIPELARAMGEAVREFRRASSQIIEEDESRKKKESGIRELALNLGIDVAGKTDEELLEEIKSRVKRDETSYSL